MKLLKGFGTGLCLTVLCVLVVPKAKADELDRKTVITFSGPVEVGGSGAQVLPAGIYVFKVMDSPSDRHIVQISNQDETHVFTLILAIPNYRLKTTDKTVITFHERPAGEPEALKAWFYPGREYGDQFVYERSKALQLAAEANETVLSTPAVLVSAPTDVLKAAPVEAVTPKGETVETAQVVEAPPAPAAATVAAAPVLVASLPKTATNLDLIGLFGMTMLGAGFLMSGFRKKSV
ncbi:MAG: LPXTG cell wall anchor domain-containing protein [Terracidiphilus sp.]|jgi:LPXTG-motif cell wall-anchored protein